MSLLVEHCLTCGRVTRHSFDGDPAQADTPVVCDECGTSFVPQPKDDQYWVTFTNMTDLSVEPAAGQYHLGTCRTAGSEAEAFAEALQWALGVNNRIGMPPHGIRVSEEELRRLAIVMTDTEVFHDGYGTSVMRHRSKFPEVGRERRK